MDSEILVRPELEEAPDRKKRNVNSLQIMKYAEPLKDGSGDKIGWKIFYSPENDFIFSICYLST